MAAFDHSVQQLAARQYGVFSRRQVLALGGSAEMIKHRLRTGRWERLHPGVYAISGSHRSWRREQMAACLWAAGAAGVNAAAYLHALPGFEPNTIEVVTTHARRPMPRCGVVVHHTKRLPREQVVLAQGIPTTSVERTLLDLCGHISRRKTAIALDQCLHQGKTTLGSLDHCLFLTARQGRDGCGVLRNLLNERDGMVAHPNSPLETLILEMLRESGLELPVLQMNIHDERGRFVARPDFVWPHARLIVEGHSKLWHDNLVVEERDRRRHEALISLGYRILYITWADATAYRESTIIRVATELRREVDTGTAA